MEDGTTILLGLPGVAVDLVSVDAAGARTVHVRTDDSTAAACPVCGVFSTSVRQHRTTAPKDLPYGEAPLCVRWRKTQYRCREARCPRKAFTESNPELPPGARVTGRLRRHAATAVGAGASVADRLPVSWPTVHTAFVAHAEAILTEPGDRLSPPARSRLLEVLRRDDPTNEIGAAWGVKELLRQLLAARDRSTISARLHRFHEAVLVADLPEATRLAQTVDDWWPEILGFLSTRITNAGTEGTNRLVKDAARIAFGFRNLDNQRRRVRFHCTRRSRRTTSAEAALPPQLR